MAKKHNNLLGIAVTEKSVQVVECRGTGPSAKVVRHSAFTADGATLFDAPERFGKALAEHLEREGYGTKHVSVGLCGRWVLSRAITVPPAEGDALAGMVRLKIERDFAGGHADLCFDYQDAPPPKDAQASGQRGLLLVGMPRRRIEKIESAFTAAGLVMVRLGATPLHLCARQQQDGARLVIDPAGLTLYRKMSGRCAGFASAGFDTATLGPDDEAAGQLAAAASRLALAVPADAAAGGALALTDTAGLDDASRDTLVAALSERFGGCQATAGDAALAAVQAADGGAVNLLDSKLAVRPTRPVPGYAKWLIRAAVLLLLVGGVVGYLWYDANRELDALRDEYAAISDNAAKLQAVRADTRAAAGWFDDRPPVLDCLLELTHTFPRRGRIWVTALSIEPDATGVVSCMAEDEATMWLYVNAMTDSPDLKSVALRRQNGAGRRGSEIVFDVSFQYEASAPPAEELQ